MKSLMFQCLFLFLFSCVGESDSYEPSVDDGTYTGSMTVYDGPGMASDFVDRTCPEVYATLVIADGNVVLTANDNYPNYGHAPGVVTSHVASGSTFKNNKFRLETGWAIEETDTQLEDLMNLNICGATPPSSPGDTSTGGRGGLKEFALKVDEPGFIGEYGEGIARGSLWYGVRCTDGKFIPICLYFMNLTKQ